MNIHNYKIGPIKTCQICNTSKISKVMDFGYQPLADDLIHFKEESRKSIFYPLEVFLCPQCKLLQTGYIVGDQTLYSKNYHYLPGISKAVVENFKNLSSNLKKIYNLNKSSVVVDVGCNDGSLLYEFKNLKISKVLGIEPTDTYKYAKRKKIKTINNFFNLKSCYKAKQIYGNADLIVTTNVFAHSNKLGDFINAAKNLIKKDGVFVIENHYLVDVLKYNQFDTFYHEHLRTYSLNSLIILMKKYGFHLVDAYTSKRYGGNIQAHFGLKKIKYNSRILKILYKENKSKLSSSETYKNFFGKILKAEKQIDNFLNKNSNKKIVIKSFPARASVILHYFSSLRKKIDTIYEQPTSNKINHYAPGTNIKIISSIKMKNYKPDIIIILAWHMFDAIKNKWKKRGLKKVKYVKPLPVVKIFK